MLNLIGQRFGKLIVLNFIGTKDQYNQMRRFWLCQCDCGNYKEVDTSRLRDNRITSCSLCPKPSQPKGDKSPSWKGGRRIDDGYVLIYKPDHPRSKTNGYIREHTIVMEEKLGRYLIKGENVHHINGIKDDNRPENLELWSSSQPPGQRIEDKVKWAKEIIELYGDL